MSFLEMPNTFGDETEDSPADPRPHVEEITAIRLRDRKTGQFVAGAGLIQKGYKPTALLEGIMAGSIGGVIANQVPQNKRSSKKALKKLDPNLSVTLRKKEAHG